MRIPTMAGIIDRRILVNYRVDPAVLAPQVPAPFRLKLVDGWGMAGICLIRLKRIRPKFVPRWFGITSENAAHRVAVEWDDQGGVREGVFIRRRDSNSWFNYLLGGRLFPGVHQRAAYTVRETDDRFDVALHSRDGVTHVEVRSRLTTGLPATSVFKSLDQASAFYRGGALGYSATSDPKKFHGLTLHCPAWKVEPLDVEAVKSSYFDDESIFPRGSIHFDCALLMRNIEHEWHGQGDLCCNAA